MHKRTFLALALAMLATSARADEELPLEHVLVSVPMHKKAAETALPVTVITGDDLKREASATLGDTLGDKPGIASASFGPGVGQPVVRGQQGPRVTVLQNGTTSADVAGLSADHANSVEPLLADSIEILRGPATLLYGGGAIGGVVNVIDNRIPTRTVDGVEGAVEYRYESASSLDSGVARLDAGNGDFMLHLDALARDFSDLNIPGEAVATGEHDDDSTHSDTANGGSIDNTDGEAHSHTIGASRHFAAGFFGLSWNHLENQYGIPPGAHEHDHGDEEHEVEDGLLQAAAHGDEDIRIDAEQDRYDAALHLHALLPGVEVLRGFATWTDYGHVELEGSAVGTRYSNETAEYRLEAVHDEFHGLHGVAGMQWRDSDFSALGEESFIPDTDSRELGLFLIEDYHLPRWLLEAALRLDLVERNPDTTVDNVDFTGTSASASALYDIDDAWQLGLSLSRSERAPATEELFSNIEAAGDDQLVLHAASGAYELGDPNLDRELSRNADLSLEWAAADSSAEVTLFYNDFTDYIFLDNTGRSLDGSPLLAYRQDDATFYGVELESEFALAELGAGTVTAGVHGDAIRGELDVNGDVPRLPPVRVGGRLAWETDATSLWLKALYAANQDNPGDHESPTDGYTRWDAGVDFRLPLPQDTELALFLSCNNIGNEEVRLSTSFLREVAPESGRSVLAGMRYSF